MTERLLGSWRTDVAPSGAKRAAMAALGVGLATTATAASASALGDAAKVGVLSIAKAIAGGALAGVVVIGTSTYIQHGHAQPAVSAPAVSVETPAKTSKRHDPPAQPTLPESEPESDRPPAITPTPAPVRPKDDSSNGAVERLPVPTEEATSRPLPTPPTGAAPSQERVSSLAREIALLDESRASLARGDATGALKLLDQHAQQFARGNLGPEAVVMRIEALMRLGDERAARALASQFALDHPNDSHLARIQSLLTNGKKSTGDRP